MKKVVVAGPAKDPLPELFMSSMHGNVLTDFIYYLSYSFILHHLSPFTLFTTVLFFLIDDIHFIYCRLVLSVMTITDPPKRREADEACTKLCCSMGTNSRS